MNDEEKVLDIHKKIEREKALINAANLMRQQTNNEAVRSKLDTQMREGRRNIEFFEEKLNELQMRRMGQGMDNMSLGPNSGPPGRPKSSGMWNEAGPPPTPPPKDGGSSYADGSSTYSGSTMYSSMAGQGELMPTHGPFTGGPPGSSMAKPRPNFTKLGEYLSHFHKLMA
jgi:classical protein kinase C